MTRVGEGVRGDGDQRHDGSDKRPLLRHSDPNGKALLKRSSRSRARFYILAFTAVLGGAALLVGVVPLFEASTEAVPRVKPEVPVTAINQGSAPANNSPVLAVHPRQPRFVALANRLDAPDFSCNLHISGDGGRGWLPARPVPELPLGAEKCYAPEVAFDGEGVLYYLFVGLQGAGNEPMGAFLTTSHDNARTFTPPRQVLGPANFGVRMEIDPTVGDRGRIHLAWLHATSDPPLGGFGPPPNPILTAHSDDGGETFSKPVQVSDANRQRVVAPALALGPDHAVHIGYYDLGQDAVDYQGLEGPTWEGTWSLVVASSTDGGQGFASGVVVDDRVTPNERVALVFTMPPPALVADDRRLCAAWTDARNGDADAVIRCSFDGGRSWQELRRLNDDAVGNGRSQYLPRLALSPDGRLHAVFYDRRASVENVVNELYYTYSTDEGLNFAENLPVTRDGSNSRIGQQYAVVSAEGQVEFGARIALLAQADSVLAAWTDTRNSKAQTTGQDIFATEIVFQTKGATTTAARVAGFILLLSGALALVLMLLQDRHGSQAAGNA